MTRLLIIAAVLGACLLVWKSGAVDGVLQSLVPSTAKTVTTDPGVELSKSVDAMSKLKSAHVTLKGTLDFTDAGEVKVTGTGDLINPHKETFSLQLQLPRATYGINERIEGGHEYIQIPSQSSAWKDVTGDLKSQVIPEMDPIDNLRFLLAARASDNAGTISMDSIDVHDITVSVDATKYIDLLKSDPLAALTAADETTLGSASIQVEAWVAASDHYLHQMRIQMGGPYSWDLTFNYSKFDTGSGTTSA